MTGQWIDEIDHENTDPGDNRWSNLRAATSSQNKANRGPNRRNQLGVKGVYKHQNGYRAVVYKDRQRIDCGVHTTVEQAAAAYQKVAAEIHKQFARS